MSGTLKKIQAPSLGAGYGQNIKNTFENIDSNFGVIGNSELMRGADGRSILSAAIQMKELMKVDGFDVVHNNVSYHVTSQRSSIVAAFSALITDEGDHSADIDAFTNQLATSTESVMCCLSYPETEDAVLDVISISPHIVLDSRFQKIDDDGRQLAGKIDLSCVFTVPTQNTWDAKQTFPTLYYNTVQGYMCWKIGGTGTSIIAQGPKGENGTSGEVYVCTIDNTPTGNATSVPVSKILNPNTGEFVDIDEYEETITVGSTAFVLVADQTPPPGAEQSYVYYVSTIRQSAGEWVVSVGDDNAVLTELGINAFRNVMLQINTESDYVKGFFIPLPSEGSQYKTGFILFADPTLNSLNIVGVSNLDSGDLVDNSKLSYNFEAPIKIYPRNPHDMTSGDVVEVVNYKFDSLTYTAHPVSDLMDPEYYNKLKVEDSVPGDYDDQGQPIAANIDGYYWKGTPVTPNNSYPSAIYIFSEVMFPTDGSLIYLALEQDGNYYSNNYQELSEGADHNHISNFKLGTDDSLPYSLLSTIVEKASVRVGTIDSQGIPQKDNAYLTKPINIVANEVMVSNRLTVGNDLSVGEDLSVSKEAKIGGNTNISGQLNVQSSAVVKGTIEVSGAGKIGSDLQVGGQTIKAKSITLTGNKNSITLIAPTLTVKDSGVSMPTNVTMGLPSSSHTINGATTFKNKVTISTIANGSGEADFVRLTMGGTQSIIGVTGNGGAIGATQAASETYKWNERMDNLHSIIKKSICTETSENKDTISFPSRENLGNANASISNPFTGMVKVKTGILTAVNSNKQLSILGVTRKGTNDNGEMRLPTIPYGQSTQYFEPITSKIIDQTGRVTNGDNEATAYTYSIAFDMGQIRMGDLRNTNDGDTGNYSLFGYDWTNHQIKLNMNIYQPIMEVVMRTGQDNGGRGTLDVNMDYYVIKFNESGSSYSHSWKSSQWSGSNPTSSWVGNPIGSAGYNKKTIYNKFVANQYQINSSSMTASGSPIIHQHCSENKGFVLPANSNGTDSCRSYTLYGKQPAVDILSTIEISGDSKTTFDSTRIQAFMIVTFTIHGGHKNFWGKLWGPDYCDVKRNLSRIDIWSIKSSYNGKNEGNNLNNNDGTIVCHETSGMDSSNRLTVVDALYFNNDTIYNSQDSVTIPAGVKYRGNLKTSTDSSSTSYLRAINLVPFITFGMFDLKAVNAISRRQRLYVCSDGIIMSSASGQYFYLMTKPHTSYPNVARVAMGYTYKSNAYSPERNFVDLLDSNHRSYPSIQWHGTYI